MTTFEKLQKHLKAELGLELVNFRRQRVGHWQRTGGAWLWVADLVHNETVTSFQIGSIFSATALLKYKKLSLSGNEVWPL